MTSRTAFTLAALVAVAYVAVLFWYAPLPLQDYPNHLARWEVMADLLFDGGKQFGRDFEFHFQFAPYVLSDLLFAGLVQLLGAAAVCSLVPVLTFISLPCALIAYLRARETPAEVIVLMVLISLCLSTDWFFAMGFIAFRLSIALVLVALALVERLRRRWSIGCYAAFAGVVVLSYLTHLGAIAFIGAAVGASSAWRVVQEPARIRSEASFLVPIAGVLVWHFLEAVGYRRPDDAVGQQVSWASLSGKISNLSGDFIRYDRGWDHWILMGFSAFFVWYVAYAMFAGRVGATREFSGLDSPPIGKNRHVLEALGFAAVFVLLYFVLPSDEVEAAYIDIRAMALAPIFLALGALSLPTRAVAREPRSSTPAILLLTLLACINLADLAIHFRFHARWAGQYASILAKLPEHSTFLPVYPHKRTGSIYVNLHASAFAVIDRKALTPYLFSGNLGDPMKYFRYRHRPYAPDEFWYRMRLDNSVDWAQVSRTYPYLLVLKPFEPERIPVRTRTIAENDVAALLHIE